MSEAPSLESITIRGKFLVYENDFAVIRKSILDTLKTTGWHQAPDIGDSLTMVYNPQLTSYEITVEKVQKSWLKYVKGCRYGYTIYFHVIHEETQKDGILIEVEARPNMWFRITQTQEKKFSFNQVQEAQIECRKFVKMLMSMFKHKVVEPVSVYPIIKRTEIKTRLEKLGLSRVVYQISKAERHIAQNNYSESLKSNRTAFEKMIDWQMKKRRIEQTDSYSNNLARLRSKGYIDSETANMLQSYYRCLSNLGVHDKTPKEPGLIEARMYFGATLIFLEYLANQLS